METGVARTVRERLTVRHVLSLVAFLAIAYGVLGDVDTVAGIALGLVIVETIQVLGDAPGIDDRWVTAGIGAFVTVASLAWLAYELTAGAETGGPAWFPALTALAGVWFLLDARESFADGVAGGLANGPASGPGRSASGRDEEMTASEVMLVMNHAHLVAEALKEGPKSVPELAEACDLTESRVREALDVTTDEGMIYRMDDERSEGPPRYALDESKTGGLAFVRSNGRRLLRRFVRPLRR